MKPQIRHLNLPPIWDARCLSEASLIVMGAFVHGQTHEPRCLTHVQSCSHIFQGGLSLKLSHQPDSCVLSVPDSMLVDPFPKSPIVVAHYHHLYFCWHLISSIRSFSAPELRKSFLHIREDEGYVARSFSAPELHRPHIPTWQHDGAEKVPTSVEAGSC